MNSDSQPELPPHMLEAIYRRAVLPEHRGNPFIEALPPYVQASELSDMFGRYPPISAGERKLSKAHRMLLVSRLNNYLEPLPSHFDVIEKIGYIVRAGYAHRNIRDKNYRKARVKLYQESMEGRIRSLNSSGPSTAPSFALFGVSGVGKSTVVDRALSFLPQVLLHSEHQCTQVVWVKLDCPPDGSMKQLLLTLLEKLDKLLDSAYLKQVGGGATRDELIIKVANIAAMHNLGVLVIDEIQNLLDAKGDGQAKMLNSFVNIANEVKIPVVTIGTPRALSMLKGTFREARRVGDHGSCIWDSLSKNKVWSYFLTSLWKYQWTANYAPLTESLSSIVYQETQGIHALVVRLIQLSQLQAIRDDSERLTKNLFIKVAGEKFKLIAPMLNALRKNNKKALQTYEDLFEKGLKEINDELEVEASLSMLQTQNQKRNRESRERTRTVSALTAMDYDQERVQEVVTALFNAQPDISCEKAVRTILESFRSTAEKSPVAQSDSLTSIVQKACAIGIGPADALKSAGLIKPPKEVA